MTDDNIKRTFIIGEEQYQLLRKIAFELKLSQSELVREALDNLLHGYEWRLKSIKEGEND
tara:strand:- start:979 stop:1158 length:180 start_codon:yes stop_codon:yes gene_type:complete